MVEIPSCEVVRSSTATPVKPKIWRRKLGPRVRVRPVAKGQYQPGLAANWIGSIQRLGVQGTSEGVKGSSWGLCEHYKGLTQVIRIVGTDCSGRFALRLTVSYGKARGPKANW
jgi:hypothetical protein